MKNSLEQTELTYDDIGVYGDTSTIRGSSNQTGDQNKPTRDGSSVRMLNPGATDNARLYAETSRLAGRLNAINVSDEERALLLSEREELLKKKLFKSISKREKNRLEFVRWSLDRIEDAKHGHILDRLENALIQYERFASEISNLQTQLASLLPSRKNER